MSVIIPAPIPRLLSTRLTDTAPSLNGKLGLGSDGKPPRWQDGFTFRPEACRAGDISDPSLCSWGSLADGVQPEAVVGSPYTIQASDSCSTFGWKAADYQGRAIRLLDGVSSFLLAREFAEGDLVLNDSVPNRPLNDPASDTVTTGVDTPVRVLAAVEQAMGEAGKGARGMIHMTWQLLTVLYAARAILQNGNQWFTPIGNLIVADAGYRGVGPGQVVVPVASQWMYGTSMIYTLSDAARTIPEGDVMATPPLLREAMNIHTNDVTVIAQQEWAFVWADYCMHIAGETDLTPPAVAGAS